MGCVLYIVDPGRLGRASLRSRCFEDTPAKGRKFLDPATASRNPPVTVMPLCVVSCLRDIARRAVRRSPNMSMPNALPSFPSPLSQGFQKPPYATPRSRPEPGTLVTADWLHFLRPRPVLVDTAGYSSTIRPVPQPEVHPVTLL